MKRQIFQSENINYNDKTFNGGNRITRALTHTHKNFAFQRLLLNHNNCTIIATFSETNENLQLRSVQKENNSTYPRPRYIIFTICLTVRNLTISRNNVRRSVQTGVEG